MVNKNFELETWSEYFTRKLAEQRMWEAISQYYKEKQNSTECSDVIRNTDIP